MSDPRASPPRSSKTAAVVMLVVFLQVLVVAVLGLGAISRDRREARRDAEERAQAEARTTLDGVVGAAAAEVQAALNDVRRFVRRFSDLEVLRLRSHETHADLVQTIYHVDPETGDVFWLDGTHYLFAPPRARERLVAVGVDADFADVFDRLEETGHDADELPSNRIRALVRLIREFPYRQSEGGYPVALGEADWVVP
ncbi:MAG: hypothetical protein ACC662_05110, partial [Planctomycetota bacterium]